MRKYIFPSVAVAVVVAVTLVYTLSSEATGTLIGHWMFDDGSATDVSSNGNNGVVIGPILTAGKVGAGSLNFDGVDDYVDLGTLDPGGTAVTLAAWVNADNLANCVASDCRIASKATGVQEQDHNIMLSTIKVGSDVRLRFRLKAGVSTKTLIAASGNLSNGVWHHVAGTYDGANMRVYVDGAEVGSIAKTGAIDSAPAVPFWIGGNPDSPTSRPWAGKIDDVRLYDGALSPGEIQTLAGSLPPTSTPESTPFPAVSFSVTFSGNQSQFGPVAFDQEVIDTHNAYDTATGIFTAPEDGVYQFSSMIVDTNLALAQLRLNGVPYRLFPTSGPETGGSVMAEIPSGTEVSIWSRIRTAMPTTRIAFEGYLIHPSENPPAPPTIPPRGSLLNILGEVGIGFGELWRPNGVFVDVDGSVLVTDQGSGDSKIVRLAQDGTVIFDTIGETDLQQGVQKVVTDSAGFIYATAQGPDDHILKFSAAGEFVSEIANRPLVLNPEGIAIAIDGSLLIADRNHDRILRLDTSGQVLQEWSSGEPGVGPFNPSDVDIASNGDIFVADLDNDLIQVFDLDGVFKYSWSIPLIDNVDPASADLAIGPSDEVYVVEQQSERTLGFNSAGTLFNSWGANWMNGVRDVAVGPAGDLYFLTEQSGIFVLKD